MNPIDIIEYEEGIKQLVNSPLPYIFEFGATSREKYNE